MKLPARNTEDNNVCASSSKRKILLTIYRRLYSAFGPQYWWPGETRLEIIVGAILTQNTNWRNVEKAISNLKKTKVLSVKSLKAISLGKLAQLIRPAGYYNIKARRLKNFIEFLAGRYRGSLKKVASRPWPKLREELLSVKGIGPETADSILLYAFSKPVFVVDSYTRRIFARHGLCAKDATYEDIQNMCMAHLKKDVLLLNEYHALLVHLAKEYCKTKAVCTDCPIQITLPKRFRRLGFTK